MFSSKQLYALALTQLPGIGSAIPLEVLRSGLDVEALLRQKELPEGLSEQGKRRFLNALKGVDAALDRAKAELYFAERKGIRVLCLGDAAYPALLAETADPPALLFCRGTADLNAPHLLSVVGTRHITDSGKELCRQLCADLAALLPDVIVVSGLAYGVDIHSHRAALSSGLQTVAVLAHGFDRIYPSLHRATAEEMVQRGALLTEYPTGTNPDKGNFVRRNRIVAGISTATVLVESAEKGGALITADLANGYSREVLAFPGRPSDEYSKGCNNLIKSEKARLVTSAEDVLFHLGWDRHVRKKAVIVEQELLPLLTNEEALLCAALDAEVGLSAVDIALKAGISFKTAVGLLAELELRGLVRQLSGGRYCLRA